MRDPLACNCITCRDEALSMRVARLDQARGLALCQAADGSSQTVELELVEAGVGDVVLVHAGVAIARLGTKEVAA